jgi:hypothetical protein
MNDYRGRPLIQVEVEERIQGLCDALEELVTTFTSVSHKRAEAEADFKYRYSRSLIEQAVKLPVASKEAIAHLKATEQYRLWKILEAQEKATQQGLTSIRSQLDALRTISANVRAAGG